MVPAGLLSSIGIGGATALASKNPAKKAMPYLNQISGTSKSYLEPYANAGTGAVSNLQTQFQNLLNNPTALMDMIGSQYKQSPGYQFQKDPRLENAYAGAISNPTDIMKQIGSQYQQSPGYQFQVDQATKAANQAAAAGGMAGSPASQQQLAQIIQGLASQDYGNFLNQGLGVYGSGLHGLNELNQEANQGYENYLRGGQGTYAEGLEGEQNLSKLGLGASSELAKQLMEALQSQSNLQYASGINENLRNGGIFGGLVGSLFG